MTEDKNASRNDNNDNTMQNENGKQVTPTKRRRQEEIANIFKKEPGILSQGDIISRLNNRIKKDFPGYQYDTKIHQSLISRDLKDLGIEPVGRRKGFVFTDRAINKAQTDEISAIFELAKISKEDIVNSSSYPLIIKINGYGKALANTLKKMHKEKILDIISLESSIIIYCTSEDNRRRIDKELKNIATNEYDYGDNDTDNNDSTTDTDTAH